MEDWCRRILLTSGMSCGLMLGISPAFSEQARTIPDMDLRAEQVVQPDVKRAKYENARIDTENFEIGIYTGFLAVEDFTVNAFTGVKASFHMTEDFFMELAYGSTTVGLSSYERGGIQEYRGSERVLAYYSASIGYNVFPGEVFVGRKYAFNTDVYLTAGIGSVRFARNEELLVSYGGGYRFIFNDWLAFHAGIRLHMFRQSNLLTANVLSTTNPEIYLGAAVFF